MAERRSASSRTGTTIRAFSAHRWSAQARNEAFWSAHPRHARRRGLGAQFPPPARNGRGRPAAIAVFRGRGGRGRRRVDRPSRGAGPAGGGLISQAILRADGPSEEAQGDSSAAEPARRAGTSTGAAARKRGRAVDAGATTFSPSRRRAGRAGRLRAGLRGRDRGLLPRRARRRAGRGQARIPAPRPRRRADRHAGQFPWRRRAPSRSRPASTSDYARFSPGVLIQLENLKILDRGDVAWMDSCAVQDHPMIDSLWTEPPRHRPRHRAPQGSRRRAWSSPSAGRSRPALVRSAGCRQGEIHDRIAFDAAARSAFTAAYPEQPSLLDHALVDHPLLQLDALAELARRIRPVDAEYNRGDLPVGLDPATRPPNGLSVEETIRDRALRFVDGAQVRRAGPALSRPARETPGRVEPRGAPL